MGPSETPDKDLLIQPLSLGSVAPAWGSALGWLLFSLVFLLRFGGAARIAVAAVDVMVLGVTVVLLTRSRSRSRLWLRGTELLYRTSWSERPVFRVGEAGSVIDVVVDLGAWSNRQRRFWCLVDKDGGARVVLSHRAWDASQLEALRSRLGVQADVRSETLSARAAAREIPGSIPWWYTRPTLTVTVVTTVLIIVGSIIVVALGAHH